MLEELRIQNFAIIDKLDLDFASGLNVITGETGAGKSIIIDAVELLLGGKGDIGSVRAGAEKAVVEGVFALKGQARALLIPLLRREDLLEEDGDSNFVTLYREIRTNGRTVARVNGVSVNLEVMREIGAALVDIHGQSEHLSLLNKKQHLDLLDRYADLLEIRDAMATLVRHLQDVRSEIQTLQADKATLQRRIETLQRDVEEIEAAKLKIGEDEDLKAERTRLANSESLATSTGAVLKLLNGDETASDDLPAVDRLMQVATHLAKLAAIDPELDEWRDLADSLAAQAQDLAIEMARYADTIEFNPKRLDQIEERLELINKLRRRYGNTIQAILEHADKAKEELGKIENSEEHLEGLRIKEDELLHHIGELALKISDVRQRIGNQLSKRVVTELKDLRMERAEFQVGIAHHEDPNGCFAGDRRLAFDATGVDDVEFLLSANPGEPMRALSKVASGGEAARIMLALKRVLTQADHTPTLIFDEVDQGIGGRVGGVVGEKLWSLTKGHQVLVVTHLPQLAGFADKHYHVRKVVKGDRTSTQVMALEEEARITELAEMLGAFGDSGKQSARDIMDEARNRKGEIAASLNPTQKSLL
ncbi:MAG: DNA repair protein RecN [Anaerolineae bacterium]|jgi:DNA repair protein RecN (Recombination protein N)|nr:DNA repair protein RecN [Anaerolineae bacterium]